MRKNYFCKKCGLSERLIGSYAELRAETEERGTTEVVAEEAVHFLRDYSRWLRRERDGKQEGEKEKRMGERLEERLGGCRDCREVYTRRYNLTCRLLRLAEENRARD